MLSHYKAQRNQIKAQHEEYKNWLSVKTKLEEKLKEQDGHMDQLQISYLNTVGERDSWKSKAFEWKDKVNQNTQEQDQLKKEIAMLQKTKVMVVESMMEVQRQFQELMQMDVQQTTLTTTSRDPEMVEENARLKTEITTLRKQLQDKESAQRQTEGSTFSPRRETTQVQTK